MNNQFIYEKNVELLKEYNGYIFEDLEMYNDEENNAEFQVCSYTTNEGNTGVYLDFGNKGIVQLGSQYEPTRYAKKWAQNLTKENKIEENSPILMFGLGSVEYLAALKKYTKSGNVIVVYEPSFEILNGVLKNIDLSKVIDKNIFIITSGKNSQDMFRTILRQVIRYSNIALIRYFDCPNYRRIFKNEYEEYKKLLNRIIRTIIENNITNATFSKFVPYNNMDALEYVLDSYSLASLVKALPAKKLAIIIAAGPSLEKNIEELKRAKGKALLVACDTAIKPLFKHGIVPDIYATVDADKHADVFTDERIRNLPVIVVPSSKSEIIKANKNKVFFDYRSGMWGNILKRIDTEYGYRGLVSGGSVANFIFSFLTTVDASPIIFVGQDLAFTDNKKHIEGTFEENQSVTKKDAEDTVMVEDIYGNMVPTLTNLKSYKEWFEEHIGYFEETEFIDATEGGAKINGTEIMNLKDVIDLKCNENIDFEKIISEQPQFLVGNMRKEYYSLVLSLPDELDEIKDKSDKLLDLYEEIDKLSEDNICNITRLKEILEQITDYTNYFDNESVFMPVIESYTATVGNTISYNAEKSLDNTKDDLKDIARRGIEKSKSIIDGVEKLKPYLEQVIARIRDKYEKEK